jgi:polar amino acid transport system substrate-binding protein
MRTRSFVKWSLALVVLALLAVLAAGVMAQEDTRTAPVAWPDLGGREVVFATTNDYPPYQFFDENNVLVGWEYDTIRDICALINCTPVFEQTSWEGMLIAVSNGDFDVGTGGITYTAERDEILDFTALFHTYAERLLVVDGESRFTDAAGLIALGDYTVGTQIGTTNELTAQGLFGADNVNSYENFGAAVQALVNGDVDAVVIDGPAGEGFIEAQGGLMMLDDILTGTQGLAFPMTPGSDLVQPFNAAMAALKASGRWTETCTKWFPESTAEFCS